MPPREGVTVISENHRVALGEGDLGDELSLGWVS